MLESIVPTGVRVAESRTDLSGVVLPAGEEAVIAAAVESRRREFTTTRELARAALRALGRPATVIGTGPRGAPRWPDGVVGSLTHCAGFRGAAVTTDTVLASLGIDAEPDAALPHGVLAAIARPAERAAIAVPPGEVHADRLLFSAKEAVYKAWSPLTGLMLDFIEAEITFDPGGTFIARLLVPGPLVGGARLSHFDGRWLCRDGLVLTSVAVPAG